MLCRSVQILITVLLIGCGAQNDNKVLAKEHDQGNSASRNFILKPILENFLKNRKVKSDVITVSCVKRRDSLTFSISDSYPFLDEIKMNGYTLILNRKVCFIGDEIPPLFVEIDYKGVPIEVREENEKFKTRIEVDQIKHSEPFEQRVCFIGTQLIECFQ